MPTIAITIPVRNRKSFTIAILQQLSEQINQQVSISKDKSEVIQLIVVDDASTDGTPELIAAEFPQVHLLHGDGDLWWTGAIAHAMSYATETLNPDYIVWLNDDITLSDDFVSQLVQHCNVADGANSKTVIGGIICDQQHPDWIVFGGVIAGQLINATTQFTQPVLNVDTLNGNIAVLPACIVADIGLPDTQRFRHYGGDFEYICRAKRNGYTAQLSSYLKATTDYRSADVIRYMPLWIQWATSAKWSQKWQVLKSLSNRRSPHNVEHMVNSINRNNPTIPKWKYLAFYCRKLIKIIGTELIPPATKQSRIQAYFQRQNVPADLVQSVLSQPINQS